MFEILGHLLYYSEFNLFNAIDGRKGHCSCVDPDQRAHNEPSHQDLHFLFFRF